MSGPRRCSARRCSRLCCCAREVSPAVIAVLCAPIGVSSPQGNLGPYWTAKRARPHDTALRSRALVAREQTIARLLHPGRDVSSGASPYRGLCWGSDTTQWTAGPTPARAGFVSWRSLTLAASLNGSSAMSASQKLQGWPAQQSLFRRHDLTALHVLRPA
ncbi:hypothetical protein IQ06DRAFT_19691 [Phaeosphaeriaceae sp. SRC1lsM3a]|nr:hypothetical protein IQ06DRAFT_19691 [Stagonospora sp. SRC1lsM3a]